MSRLLMKLMINRMQSNPEWVWGWHCTIAMAIYDNTDASHQVANETAAYLMRLLFRTDTSKNEHYAY